MNTEHYTGIWRSYKTFFAHGQVAYHEKSCYRELTITDNGDLTLTSFSTFTEKEVLKKEGWHIQTDRNRRFLYLEGRKAFEIITLEQDALVLQELVSGEKIFFASLST